MDEMDCSDMIRKYTSMNTSLGVRHLLSRQNSQVAEMVDATNLLYMG